jgi:putative nucleotidyltransferase with HDIG domain
MNAWLLAAVRRVGRAKTVKGKSAAVLRSARSLTGASGGAIFLGEAATSWDVAAQSGLEPKTIDRLGTWIASADLAGAGAETAALRKPGFLLLPFRQEGRRPTPIGAMALAGAGRLDPVVQRTLLEFVGLVRAPLGSAVDRASLARALAMQRGLLKAARKINSSLDTERVIGEIISLAARVIMAEAGALLLYNPISERLEFKVAHGGGGEAVKSFSVALNEGIAGWVASRRRGLIVTDVRKDRRYYREVSEKTGFETRSILSVPMITKGRLIGVIELLNKKGRADGRFTKADLDLLNGLAAQAAVAIENAGLYRRIQDLYLSTIRSLAEALDAKDPYTRGHSDRVAGYADALARHLGCGAKERRDIRYAALLHDIGKIGVSEAILNKPGSLSDAELTAVRRHAEIGATILGPVDFLGEARELVRHHHGWFDGHGQPGGTRGEAIPLGARIIAVADAFDAMSSDRVYRRALTKDECRERLLRGAGTQWDGLVVERLIDLLDRGLLGNRGLSGAIGD